MDAAADEKGTEKVGACVQCMEKCQREHRASSGVGHFSSSAHLLRPCFLRVVLEHNVRNNMSIPKAFVQMHGRGLPGSTVDLEGVNGKVWLVTVVNSSTGTAVFRFGWHVFAADNNLKAGDSILFTMVAQNRFTVRVFSKNGLESVNNNNNNNNASSTMSRDSSRFPPTAKVGPAHINLDDSDDEVTGSGRLGSDENGREAGIHGGRGPTIQEIIQNARAYQTSEDPIRRRSGSQSWRPKRRRSSPDAHQGSPVEMPGANSTVLASRRRPVTTAERESALAESRRLVTTLTRPSVAVVMMPSHVYHGFWLNLANEFSRQHLPYRKVRITLKDTWGHEWDANWIGDDDPNGISGGWAAFSKDHCLEEGDVCVFELLDSEKYILRVHICRVVEIPFVPGKRGPPGWDVTYKITKPNPPLPDLNDTERTESDVHPRTKRNCLADVLQEMIRSGQFSKWQREEHEPMSSKIRALAESGIDIDEDVKPDVKPNSSPFKRPNSPFNLSSDTSVKADPEGVFSMSSPPAHRPSPTKSDWRSTGVEVKAEPTYVVKTEDVSAEELSPVSPVAVYRRRRRKEGPSSSVATSRSTEGDERVWYPVVALLTKRQREDKAEKEYLVEILGKVSEKDLSSVEEGPDGLWWVPSSHFSTDLSGCYFR